MNGAMHKNRLHRSCIFLVAAFLLLTVTTLHAADERHLDEEGRVRLDSVWVELLAGDSLWADSSHVDSLIQIDSLQFEEKKKAPVLAQVAPGFHPTYRGSWDKIRTTTKWNHRLALAYRLADNVVVSDTTIFESQESSTTSRLRSSRTDAGGFQYLIRQGMKVSLRFNQKNETDKPAGEQKDIQERRLNLNTSLRHEPWKGATFTFVGGAGLTRREKNDEKPGSEGTPLVTNNLRTGLNTRLKLDFQYRVAPGFKISLDGNLVQGSTRIETSGNTIETSVQDDNQNNSKTISFSLRQQNVSRAKLMIQASKEEKVRSYGIASGDVEETTDNRTRGNIRVEGDLTGKLKYETKITFAKAKRRYRLDEGASSDRLDLKGAVKLKYKLPSKIQSQFNMSRSRVEDTYFPNPGEPDRTGKTERGEMALNMSRPFWKDTNVQTASSIMLTRKELIDSTQDKDDITKRLTLSVDHKSSRKPIEGAATISVDESQSVNIHSSRSSNNQNRQTWALTPTVVVKPVAGMIIRNSYNLRLVYVFNDKDSSRNTMNRIRELRTAFRWAFIRRTSLMVNYRFKVDENGAFEGSGITRNFLRNGETSTQKIVTIIRYSPGLDIELRTSQSFEVVKRYDIQTNKELLSSTNRVQIVNNVEWERTLPRESQFRIAAKQTQSSQIPTFQSTGTVGRSTKRMEWEIRTSLTFKL